MNNYEPTEDLLEYKAILSRMKGWKKAPTYEEVFFLYSLLEGKESLENTTIRNAVPFAIDEERWAFVYCLLEEIKEYANKLRLDANKDIEEIEKTA